MKNFIFLFCFSAFSFFLTACHHCQTFIAGKTIYCSAGYTGYAVNKKEGDGATPVGEFPLRKVFYRPDRILRSELVTGLPLVAMKKNTGWCDDVKSSAYNQEVTLPFAPSHEDLWRNDEVYDIVIVVGYNDEPIIKGKGSAIFLHIARPGYTPTLGCIAFSKKDLLFILRNLNSHSRIKIASDGSVSFD